ncbi:MAG TPA: hypothetical protein VIH48_03515 [Candidatus Bathyarchaeia archaeon]
MFGTFDNFPKDIHKEVTFTFSASTKRLQQKLVQILHKLNTQTLNLEEISDPSVPHCTVIIEFGIAETNNFKYLDDEETNKTLKTISKSPLQTMDLLCSISYYKTQGEKKTPLRFDYYMIRLNFENNLTTIQISHKRGPRHTSPNDIAYLIINKINEAFGKKTLRILLENPSA